MWCSTNLRPIVCTSHSVNLKSQKLISSRAVLRAFQGIGGAGCFAVTTVMMADMVPPEKLAKLVAGLSSVYAISLLVGPIIGGVLSSQSTWRWVFLIKYVSPHVSGIQH